MGKRFCVGCGGPISESDSFCAACGASQAKAKAGCLWTALKTATGAFVLLVVIAALSGPPPKTPVTGATPARNTPTRLPSQAQPRKGEAFSVGFLRYRVERSLVIASVGPLLKAKGSFVVVVLSVQNLDKTASAMPPFVLLDSEGAEYSEAPTLGQTSESIGVQPIGALESMNPGTTVRGFIMFDVADPRKRYRLRVSGGFTSGESAIVDL